MSICHVALYLLISFGDYGVGSIDRKDFRSICFLVIQGVGGLLEKRSNYGKFSYLSSGVSGSFLQLCRKSLVFFNS